MKIQITLLLIFTSVSFVNAQIYTPNGTIQGMSANNNVGIGTNIPSDKLTVAGSTQIDSNILLGHTGDTNKIVSREVSQTLTIGGSDLTSFETYSSGWLERMRIANNGNVGIGTISPSDKLTVAGSTQIDSNILLGHTGDTNKIVSREVSQILTIGGSDITTFETYSSGWSERMRIANNGNVGIGTINPTNKLDVNGTIHSKKVKVDMNNWSDFVFKKEYDLPTLKEVEKHITEKGHLENIPSEEEVLKNGINLGEMNSKLLQKIEEMTLYMIEQNKQIIDLQHRLEKVELSTQ
ncbi:hypothetical protein [uncultured Flavobacterium sp.]|uniref:hypothetical protein n=1 Tax=uncultured Flavobacterium sp. TaxID=165435 RepID=UPI00292FE38F|nr:hypothetical protein [uncultured Flavobacterium sp.]